MIDQYEKEIEARCNEMTALKLQIRPHFVLNCMKSVYALVQTGLREDAQQLILLLSRYLRYILSFTSNMAPLSSEVEQCCNYADLSSIGQPEPIQVICSLDKELSSLPLPQVSLLTLVENSVKHGRVIGRPLRITITARRLRTEDGWVAKLTVADNGNGFSAQELQSLNRELPQEKEGSHVGLRNVVRRTQLLYGDGMAVAFANKGGARIELFLPLDTALNRAKEGKNETVDRG